VEKFATSTESSLKQVPHWLTARELLLKRHPIQMAIDLLWQRTVHAYVLKEPNGSVYRFLRSEVHAQQFANGKIYISTLGACRGYEEEGRGDREEGFEKRIIDHAVGGSNDAAFVKMARNIGIGIGEGCSNITISNATGVNSIHDAYVLCTTDQFNAEKLGPRYGEYCVEITNPIAFFHAITRALLCHAVLNEAVMGPVVYSERLIRNMDDAPGPIGFVKPPDIYASDQEYRFLWTVKQTKIVGIVLDVPEARRYLRRLV
jgi:hypothetical protein